MTDLPTSVADLDAIIKQAQAAKKAAKVAEQQAFAVHTQPIVDKLVIDGDYSESDKSAWAGFSANALPVTGPDGKSYLISVTLTDVARKAERVQEAKDSEQASA